MTTAFTYTDFANGQWDPAANTQGAIAALSDTLKLAAIDGTLYTPDRDADIVLSDIPGGAIIATADISGAAVTARGLTFDPASFGNVVAGPDITAVVLYKDSGDPTTSPLMVFTDDAATGLPVVTDGTEVVVNPGAGGIAIL